jgi:hypothetical protein
LCVTNNTRFNCRVVSQQFRADLWDDYVIDDVKYSSRIALSQADALLVLYDPSEEMLNSSTDLPAR